MPYLCLNLCLDDRLGTRRFRRKAAAMDSDMLTKPDTRPVLAHVARKFDSYLKDEGGSIATSDSNCNKWFWNISRITPTLS